jgi:hypothetical protein
MVNFAANLGIDVNHDLPLAINVAYGSSLRHFIKDRLPGD